MTGNDIEGKQSLNVDRGRLRREVTVSKFCLCTRSYAACRVFSMDDICIYMVQGTEIASEERRI